MTDDPTVDPSPTEPTSAVTADGVGTRSPDDVDHDVDHDVVPGSEAAVHDRLNTAVADARAGAPTVSADALITDVDARRRNRAGSPTRRVAALGAAAAVLVLIVGIAVATRDPGSNAQLTASVGGTGETAAIALAPITVDPAVDLVDGQQVQVTVNGFDEGADVLLAQCFTATGVPGICNSVTSARRGTASIAVARSFSGVELPTEAVTGSTNLDLAELAQLVDGSVTQQVSCESITGATTSPSSGSAAGSSSSSGSSAGSSTAGSSIAAIEPSSGAADLPAPSSSTPGMTQEREDASSTGTGSGDAVDVVVPPAPVVSPGSDGTDAGPTDAGTTSSGPTEPGSTEPGSTGAGTASPDDPVSSSTQDAPPCSVVAIGLVDDEWVVVEAPITFAPTDDASPGTTIGAPITVPGDDGEVPAVPTTMLPTEPPRGIGGYGPNGPLPDDPTTLPGGAADCPSAKPQLTWPDAPVPSGPLLTFVPTSVLVCGYDFNDVATSRRVVDDASTIDRIRSELAALTPVSSELACTMEKGPSVAIVASEGTRHWVIWVELYGCGFVSDSTNVLTGGKSLGWLLDLP